MILNILRKRRKISEEKSQEADKMDKNFKNIEQRHKEEAKAREKMRNSV